MNITGVSSKSHYHRDTAGLEASDAIITRPSETDESYRQPLAVPKDAMPPRSDKIKFKTFLIMCIKYFISIQLIKNC